MYSRRRWHGTSRPRLIYIYILCMSFPPKTWRTIQKIIFKWCSFLRKWLWTYPTEPQAEVWLKEDPVRSGDWKHYIQMWCNKFVSNLRQKANLRQPQHKDFSIYLRVNWWNLLQQFLWTSAHNKHPSRHYCCIAFERLFKTSTDCSLNSFSCYLLVIKHGNEKSHIRVGI